MRQQHCLLHVGRGAEKETRRRQGSRYTFPGHALGLAHVLQSDPTDTLPYPKKVIMLRANQGFIYRSGQWSESSLRWKPPSGDQAFSIYMTLCREAARHFMY